MALMLEREAELAGIARAVEAGAAGRGTLLLVEGPAGIGKTALLGAAGRIARAAGMAVLSAEASELERDFGFGVVRQLFEEEVRDARPSLLDGGHARLATPVFAPGTAGAETAQPVLHGLYWLTVTRAERGPLALLVDDAQWADPASERFLSYLARRLDGLPVLLVVARRSAGPGDLAPTDLARAERLRPRPLSPGATEDLVGSLVPGATEALARACHAATGGNAFYVHELAHALHDEPDADPRRVEGWSPERIVGAVSARIAALPPGALELARATAILGDGTPLRRVAALAEVDGERAGELADALRAAGILGPEARIAFLHPILRAAVDGDVAPGAASLAHTRAARLLAADDASPERVAAHLSVVEPAGDPWSCARLVEAGREALARGAPEVAARHLARALDEPPAAEDRAGLLLELATAEALVFSDRAADHLHGAFRLGDREERLEATLTFASLQAQNALAAEAVALLAEVRDEFAGDPAAVAEIEAHMANVGRFQISARRLSRPTAERLLAGFSDSASAAVLSAVGAELTMRGEEAARVVGLARRALADDGSAHPLLRSQTTAVAVRTLVMGDALDEATQILDAAVADAQARGAAFDFAFLAFFRGEAAGRRGAVWDAEADARSAYALAREHTWPMGLPGAVALLLTALVERGELDEADGILRESGLEVPAAALPDAYTSHQLLLARGRLRLAQGRIAAALEDLEECGRRQTEFGEPNPALACWRSEAALGHARLGDRERAKALAGEELRLARRFGAARAIGIALRAAGLVHGGDPGLGHLREAAAVLERSPARLEHARALTDLGAALHERGEDEEAQPALRLALDLAHSCGATALERRARDVLRATGARPRRPLVHGAGALTPSERRVARMASQGMTNRAIAEALFVTVRTVEFHLVGTYRKLGIASRRELPGALAA